MARRAFSDQAIAQAETAGYITALQRASREFIQGFPIDQEEPDRATDRDDAVFVERHGNGYHVAVTIADVAAHIPKGSPLDREAMHRAFTIYRPNMRDPMFPFVLSEDRFSLENNLERLGLTTHILLDAQFQTVSVSFSRTLITPQCFHYHGAAQRSRDRSDSNFALLQRVAHGLAQKPQITKWQSRSQRDLYYDKQGRLRHASEEIVAISKLVELLMILANNETSNFFNRAALPFLFRNHHEDGLAEYGTTHEGHDALTSVGLVGAYGHCTSPIRRYPDVINQRMAHYAIDVADQLRSEAAGVVHSASPTELDAIIWSLLPGVLSPLHQIHTAHNRTQAFKSRNQLYEGLQTIASALGAEDSDAFITACEHALMPCESPYDEAQLASICQIVNKANVNERRAIREDNALKMQRWREHIMEVLMHRDITALEKPSFSALLRKTALTGELPEDVYRECKQRLAANQLDIVKDAYSMLMLAEYDGSPRWAELKRQTLNRIEREPVIINNIVDMAMSDGQIHPDTYMAQSVVLDAEMEDVTTPEGEPEHISTALLVTYRDDDQQALNAYAAPHFSLGYRRKDAERHAKFNFIRSVAFGELGPIDQSILPTPLYAELSRDDQSSVSVLQHMTTQMGLTLDELGPQRKDEQVRLAYRVYGPGIDYPILGVAARPTEQQARAKAATQILRSTRFKRAYANQHPVSLNFPRNPVFAIHELAESRGWALDEPLRQEIPDNKDGTFTTYLSLFIGGHAMTEQHTAKNKYDARMACYSAMLEKLTARELIPRPTEAHAQPWTSWAQSGDELT